MPVRRPISSCALVLGLLCSPAAAAEGTKLMVMDIGANGVPEATAVTVSELVAVELSRYRPLDVASGADVRKLLEVEAAREMTQCEDETSCMVMVADALGAELIVHGKAAALGSSTLVTLHLFDTAAGRSLSRTSFTVKNLDELPAAVARGVRDLVAEPLASRGVKAPGGAAPSSSSGPGPGPAGPSSTAPAAPAFAMKDLEALGARGAHKELLARALDVPASQRSKKWEALVATSATAVLEKAAENDAFEALKLDESLRELYPQATRAPGYRAVQSRAVAGGIGACFVEVKKLERRLLSERAHIPDCARMAELYVERAQAPPSEALELARLVRRNRHPSMAAGLFLAAAPGPGAPACKDPGLEQATLSALHERPGTPLAAAGKTLAFERCYAELAPSLKGELARSAESSYFVNACPDLVKKRALGKLQTKRCERRMKAQGS